MTSGTEDETFKILSRPGFDEMLRIFTDWWRTQTNSELKIEFMKKHNWTWLEFVLEVQKRNMNHMLF